MSIRNYVFVLAMSGIVLGAALALSLFSIVSESFGWTWRIGAIFAVSSLSLFGSALKIHKMLPRMVAKAEEDGR